MDVIYLGRPTGGSGDCVIFYVKRFLMRFSLLDYAWP